ncbi:MAG TPA: hypothetical protein VFE51_22825 [Verrucomicrobiae bacterium]|nr:hypothetical protein [Verrucomicrobiae bacterium]
MPLSLNEYLSLECWSVQFGHLAYDDARRTADGVWYYRDIVSNEIVPFPDQSRVVPLCPTDKSAVGR